MLDFTSALYLGLRHPSGSLRPWSQLTLGRPATLGIPESQAQVAQRLAGLIGCARAILAPSTLHLFWDLFWVLADRRSTILVDSGSYPIARWGVERAAARGVPTSLFAHHNPGALDAVLNHASIRGRSPIVVADGFCPGCGEPAPIRAYLKSVRTFGGYLVLDDTQSLGILGHSQNKREGVDYGLGGGGALRFSDVSGPDIVIVSSLAKGFGVPVAVLAGDASLTKHFEEWSETQVHSSPPSSAVLRATERALSVNRSHGDALRARLTERVLRFRDALSGHGLHATGGLFPVQTPALGWDQDAKKVHARLAASGIRSVLHTTRGRGAARISFLLTARHRLSELDQAVEAIAKVCANTPASILEASHG